MSNNSSGPQNSLDSLPPEIRLRIFSYLLDSTQVPRGRSYLNKSVPNRPLRLILQRRNDHALLYVNKRISDEYSATYFERTTVFLYINSANVKPPFWSLPKGLLTRLRHAKLIVDCPKYENPGGLYEDLLSLLALMEGLRTMQLTLDLPSYEWKIRLPHLAKDTNFESAQDSEKDYITKEALHENFRHTLMKLEHAYFILITVNKNIRRWQRKRIGQQWVELDY